MRSLLTGATFTVALLLFSTLPVSAQTDEMVGPAYLDTMIQIEVKTKITVASGQMQYRQAVERGNRKKIKLAKPILQQALSNQAVANDLVETLKQGKKIKRKHARGCRKIANDLSSALVFLSKNRFRQVEIIIIKIEQTVQLQPSPVNPNVVLLQLNQIQQQIIFLRDAQKRGSTRLKKLNELQTVEVQKRKGSKKGGTVVVVQPKPPVVIQPKPPVVVIQPKPPVVVVPPKKPPVIVPPKPPVVDPPVVECHEGQQLSPCWKCEAGVIVHDDSDPGTGLECYSCKNGLLNFADGRHCEDGDKCTENDICSSGRCRGGQAPLSPIDPSCVKRGSK
jgi:hypothetical protein